MIRRVASIPSIWASPGRSAPRRAWFGCTRPPLGRHRRRVPRSPRRRSHRRAVAVRPARPRDRRRSRRGSSTAVLTTVSSRQSAVPPCSPGPTVSDPPACLARSSSIIRPRCPFADACAERSPSKPMPSSVTRSTARRSPVVTSMSARPSVRMGRDVADGFARAVEQQRVHRCREIAGGGQVDG